MTHAQQILDFDDGYGGALVRQVDEFVLHAPPWLREWVGGYLGIVAQAREWAEQLYQQQGKLGPLPTLAHVAMVVREVFRRRGYHPSTKIRLVQASTGQRLHLGWWRNANGTWTELS